MLIPVILSGGSGNRLWPLSRESYPKQLLNLIGANSLLQDTALRALQITENSPIIICNQSHRFMVADQLSQISINPAHIFLEPVGRNTAPAIAIAALQALEDHQDALLLVLPADHVVLETRSFVDAVRGAEGIARTGKLVTFGVAPTRPETGFGYIKAGENIGASANIGTSAYVIEKFIEKPNYETALQYCSDGGYFWNSGVFLFLASSYLRELELHAPDMLRICKQAFVNKRKDLTFYQLDKEIFSTCPSDSVDYAIMEKTSDAAVVPIMDTWYDVGSWKALSEVQKSDDNGNVLLGDVVIENVTNSYIRSHDRLVAAIGVKDHVIVETTDAVLVAHKDHSQDVKKIVERLQGLSRSEATTHKKIYRPWGFYETLSVGDCFHVKKITVYPGGKLSLQKHHHRSEHWVIVSGIAQIIRGDEQFALTANQSTYIPVETMHRICNDEVTPLEIIEVQLGDYLGEDDIIRYEDEYARVS